MRHLAIDPAWSPSGTEQIPTELLGSVQDLPERFGCAGLRPVALVRASGLDQKADPSGQTRIWLALECLQITGSFKVRGALCALQDAKERGASAVVAASAGNHGAGVAHAARVLGLSATIVVPHSTPQTKLERMTRGRVRVLLLDGGYDQAEAYAKQLAHQRDLPFISPYDDLLVLLGNGASLGFELVQGLGKVPEHVLVPMGGGGLATGLGLSLAHCAGQSLQKKRRVWTVQSQACPAFALSLEQKKALEQLEASEPTLAEGLEGGISARGFARASSVVQGVSVVSEASIAQAMAHVHAELGIKVEGSAATALVPVLLGLPSALLGGDLVVVLTGRNVDEHVFEQVVQEAQHC